ncbi:glycosyltransferase family 4 protein [Bacillus sp. BRMEA1]|uniref:glycosyltransferase family 4 protein n=1 Tax=Neobacillus endophyticus TaxID=2738405 RepID=UPI0015667F0B|nr:glycosyltransferase family 4 protein [Neobacillus endophyticus]NRD78503.1 glycosyltransferase family 4 protein [Neobacillus endophyticus]
MKLLFTFYHPSGGMGTLNHIRCEALQQAGVTCHLLYSKYSQGYKNIKGITTFITNQDEEIRDIIHKESYDAIIVASDYFLLEKLRNLGYKGTIIYEVQGFGDWETSLLTIQTVAPYVITYSNAVLLPDTSHLVSLFKSHTQSVRQFSFNLPLDTRKFRYIAYPIKPFPIIGWVGRIEHNKNWSDFLEIGHRMIEENPHLYLWMFCDMDLSAPSEKERFESKVDQLELRSRLIRYVNVPQQLMADYYSIIGDSGGFLCSTSFLEGFGYAVAEALLCRCPVLATDSDGVRRFIFHNKTGMFYNRGDIDDAVQKANDMMINKSLRTTLREAGEMHILKHFSEDAYVRNFIYMLKNLGIAT